MWGYETPERCSEPGMECGKTRLKFPSKCLCTNKNKIQEKPWPLGWWSSLKIEKKKKTICFGFQSNSDGSSFLRDFTVLALFKKHCLKTWSNLDLSRIPHHPTWKWEKVSPAHTSKKDLEYIENAQCSMLLFFLTRFCPIPCSKYSFLRKKHLKYTPLVLGNSSWFVAHQANSTWSY